MLRFGLLLLLVGSQTQPKPLPELQTFLAQVRKSLHTDDRLLNNYTYTEKRTSIQLNSNGQPKKTEVNVFQILPGSCERPGYRRQIVKNGLKLTESELARQDREHERQVAAGGGQGDRKRRSGGECEENSDDDATVDEIFGLYDFRITGREIVAGQNTLVVTFRPRRNYKPKTPEGEYMKRIAGRAWVSESDYQLARLDAEVIEDISFGMLNRLKKGARIFSERRKFNDEVWLPARMEMTLAARVMLLGSMDIRETVEYTDHQKVTSTAKSK